MEDYKGAIKDYTMAIELIYEYDNAYFGRGMAKFFLGLFDEACNDWKKADELDYPEAKEIINEFC